MSDFTWTGLRNRLLDSAYLLESDDIGTQRGLVATAIAITERMTRWGCNVPASLPVIEAPPPAEMPAPAGKPTLDASAPAAPIRLPLPLPTRPGPSGAAVQLRRLQPEICF